VQSFSLDHLTDTQFEEFCYDLLSELGFTNINWRKGTGLTTSPSDRGRDIECHFVTKDIDGKTHLERWFIECKHYQQGVPPDKIQGALAWATAERPTYLLIIASNFLSNATKDFLENYTNNNRPGFRIKYWEKPDIEKLTIEKVAFLRKHGVISSTLTSPQLDQMLFTRAYEDLEKALYTTLLVMDELPPQVKRKTATWLWGHFAHQTGRETHGYSEILSRAIEVQYEISRNSLTSLTPTELVLLTSQLDGVTDFIRNYPISTNVLTKLKEKYPQWVRPEISSVRIVHKSQTVFLEVTETKYFDDAVDKWTDEKVTRIDVGYLFMDMGEEFFKVNVTAEENAELFLSNPYICPELFTAEGCDYLIQNTDEPKKPTGQLERYRALLTSDHLANQLRHKSRTGEVLFSEAVKSITLVLGVNEDKGALIVYGDENKDVILSRGTQRLTSLSKQTIVKRIINGVNIQAAFFTSLDPGEYVAYDEELSTLKTVNISAGKVYEVSWTDLGVPAEN
jgi:hypothetical protein